MKKVYCLQLYLNLGGGMQEMIMTRDEGTGTKAKACDYCDGGYFRYLPVKFGNNGDMGIRAEIIIEKKEDPYLQIYVDKYLSAGYFDIHFCPMCGRGLK